MAGEIKALTELLQAVAVYPLVGLDIWFGWMMLRSFKRDTPLVPKNPLHYWYCTFGARAYFILCLLLTGALIYQHVL